MTTKKSKPASLTSSLLARKGEAEPATAPYSIPESGRQRPADAASGKGNGNGTGSDLGHALSGVPRSLPGETGPAQEPVDVEGAKNGVRSDAVQASASEPRDPAADDLPDEAAIEEALPEAEVAAFDTPELPDPEDADLPAVEVADDDVELPDEIEAAGEAGEDDETTGADTGTGIGHVASAEEIMLGGAVAEEASVDEAVIEASRTPDNAAERIAAETAAAIARGRDGTFDAGAAASERGPDRPADDDGAGEGIDRDSDAGRGSADAATPLAAALAADTPGDGGESDPAADEVDREAARDARLLRFVYAMAALTGIVAIVLYAGGWLRDGQKEDAAESSVAVTGPATSGTAGSAGETGSSETAMTSPGGDSGTSATGTTGTGGESGLAAIPAAPPVTAPPVTTPDAPGTDESGSTASGGLTTGGPAKPAGETAMPPAPSLESPSDTPSHADTTSAAPAVTPPAESSGSESPASESPGGAGDSGASGSTETASGTAETPSTAQAGTSDSAGIDTSGAVPSSKSTATGSSKAASTTGDAPAASASGGETTAASESGASPVVVPTPAAPESVAPPPVSTEPAREVPNMRVLAPALVRPEPAETAPPTGSAPAAGATASATAPSPAAEQTASLPKAAAPAPTDGPYRVQLSSVRSEARAEREWTRLQKTFPDFFADRSLLIEKTDIAGRGTFFRVQTGGYETLSDARSVCSSLKAKKQGCLAIKR